MPSFRPVAALPATAALLIAAAAHAAPVKVAPSPDGGLLPVEVDQAKGAVLLTLPALTGQWEGIFGQATARLSALFGGR
jgi:hypothetical protein